jgi:hypothetical protein
MLVFCIYTYVQSVTGGVLGFVGESIWDSKLCSKIIKKNIKEGITILGIVLTTAAVQIADTANCYPLYGSADLILGRDALT